MGFKSAFKGLIVLGVELLLQLIPLNDTHTHTYAHTLGRTSLDEGTASCRDLYLTTHNILKKQRSMFPEGIDPAIPARKRLYTHALDTAATGMDMNTGLRKIY